MTICQKEEREAGRAYPRTCPTCGLDPCQKYRDANLAMIAALRAKNERLREAIATTTSADVTTL